MKVEFNVELYRTITGSCPVQEFLDDLRGRDINDFKSVVAALIKLRDSRYHRPPLYKPIGNGLYELRHVGKLNTRILYSFMVGRRIIAVHGIRNKAQVIPKRVRETALERKNDWFLRFGTSRHGS